jgi:hypothetical protein
MVPVPQYFSDIKSTKQVGWTKIEDNDIMYSLLLRKKSQQLMQSAKSPFVTGSMTKEGSFGGESPLSKKLIDNLLSNQDRERLRKDMIMT